MLSYKFTYLIGSLLFLVYWFFLFFKLKQHRKFILIFSTLFAVIGFASGFLFTIDWWHPDTLFGYRFSIEDIILGFTNGGIAATSFLLFYKEKYQGRGLKLFSGSVPFLLVLLITTVLVVFFSFSSFYANVIGMVAAVTYILFFRIDLFLISMLSGLLILTLSLPVYLLMMYVSPGWVEHTWIFENLSGILLFGIPVEDFIWYFFAGAFISILYPYYKNIYYEKNYNKN